MKHPLIQLLAFMLFAAIDATRSIVGRTAVMANVVAGTVQSSPGKINRKAEAAFATPHVLVKQGTADDEVLICGANDRPIGSIDDVSPIDQFLNVFLLGCARESHVLTASGDIDAGEPVYTAAAGEVQDLPTAAGTYYQVGVALTSAADGEEVNVDPCSPIATVISG